jgi:hypothetical protein
MDYAVVVYFDKNNDGIISELMRNICNEGVNLFQRKVG